MDLVENVRNPASRPLRIAQTATVDIAVMLLLRDQIDVLRGMGHSVTVVCAPGPNVARLRADGLVVETVPMHRELSPAADLRSLWRLTAFFRRHRFDVVHTHTPKAGLIGPLAARLAGVPMILHTIHGLMFHDRMTKRRQATFWLAERITAAGAHHLLSQSEEDVETACRTGLCAPQDISYLGNGIDVERFAPPPPHLREATRVAQGIRSNEIVVGFVGRLVTEKGVLELMEALRTVTRTCRNVTLLVVGPEEHDQNDALKISRLQSDGANCRVIFTGFQTDMPKWYAAMDVFVLPTYREGIPRAAMEASATGLPVIATDIRGCREVVRHGVTGCLVPVRDVAALAEAIGMLADQPAMRRQLGAAGPAHIRRYFDRRLVHERLREIYGRVASARLARRNSVVPRPIDAPLHRTERVT